MTTQEAIQFLTKKGYKVYSDGKPEDYDTFPWKSEKKKKAVEKRRAALRKSGAILFRVWLQELDYGVMTAKELIKFARTPSAITPAGKKTYKKKETHKARAAAKRAIKNEDFDQLSDQNPHKTILWDLL